MTSSTVPRGCGRLPAHMRPEALPGGRCARAPVAPEQRPTGCWITLTGGGPAHLRRAVCGIRSSPARVGDPPACRRRPPTRRRGTPASRRAPSRTTSTTRPRSPPDQLVQAAAYAVRQGVPNRPRWRSGVVREIETRSMISIVGPIRGAGWVATMPTSGSGPYVAVLPPRPRARPEPHPSPGPVSAPVDGRLARLLGDEPRWMAVGGRENAGRERRRRTPPWSCSGGGWPREALDVLRRASCHYATTSASTRGVGDPGGAVQSDDEHLTQATDACRGRRDRQSRRTQDHRPGPARWVPAQPAGAQPPQAPQSSAAPRVASPERQTMAGMDPGCIGRHLVADGGRAAAGRASGVADRVMDGPITKVCSDVPESHQSSMPTSG
jgi:hypothetical protein